MADEPQIENEPVEEIETEPIEEEPDDDAKPFDGEYDAARARRTIDKLRGDIRDLKKQKEAPKDDPERDRLTVENLQLRVALELGIPEKLATRLRGSTREELIEDAGELLDTVSPQKREEPKSQQPKPRLKGGSQPQEEPELSAKDIAANLRI